MSNLFSAYFKMTRLFQFIIIAIAIAAVYGHTLDVPFYLDDFSSIIENPAVHTLDLKKIWDFAPLRVLCYFSFALNYYFQEFNPIGYHIINIFIHFAAVYALLFFAEALLSTPQMNSASGPVKKWTPFLAAMLFALHPLQTQAVTYVVQRSASMAALFYISSLTCYVNARISHNIRLKTTFFICTLFFALLAFFTKQNMATLPVSIFMIEVIFFSENKKQLAITGAGIFLGFAAIWMLFSQIFHYNPLSLSAMQAISRETADISRGEYLSTQFKILWIYIRLFFFPAGLHLDYNILPVQNFFESFVIFGFLGHLILITAAIFFRRNYPILSFGILFYYIAHSVESGFIPISDLCFEHRTYLPNAGLCIGMGCLFAMLNTKWNQKYATAVIAGILFFTLGIMTWQRNQIWRDPIKFWADCADQAPKKSRVWAELGKHYLLLKKYEKAANAFEKAISLSSDKNSGEININLANNLVVVLHQTGQTDRALKLANQLRKQKLTPIIRFYLLNNMGNILLAKKKYLRAEGCYRRSAKIYPENAIPLYGLYRVLIRQGRHNEATVLLPKIQRLETKSAGNKITTESIK
ncbi:protein O-mannosyl-transferase [Candidatus Magnetomoraceae bacterium gMMP-1]